MTYNANDKVIDELLDIMVNDSENPERLLPFLSDNCVWTLEPGGTIYKGSKQIKKFIEVAMSHKTKNNEKPKGIKLINQFRDKENLCIEYSHSFMLNHILPFLKKVIVKHYNTYHLENGKIQSVHEYASAPSWWFGLVMQTSLAYIHWETMRN